MSKILEKVIYKCVYTFLDTTDQLYQSQYAFRSKHLCEHAVQELLGNVLKASENKEFTVAIFLDLSKAFDSLVHHVLLRKLDKYGIRGISSEWFASYLSNRQMHVKCIAGENRELCYSTYRKITYGVSQGSCLGPLLLGGLSLHLNHLIP